MSPTPARHIPLPPLSRRTLLRAAGAGIGLPLLDAMLPGFAAAAPEAGSRGPVPRRLVAIHAALGMMPQFFFPAQPADGGQAALPSSPYLDLLAPHGGQFTVLSGMSHPEVDGNHHAGQCFLTGAPHPGQPTFKNSISLDQVAAEAIGLDTRFPFLAVSVQKGEQYSNTLAVSRSGVDIPSEASAKRLYRAMFVAGTPEEKAATLRRIQAGGSVLDLVLDKKARLERAVGPEDRGRLDQYFSSVRELEGRLQKSIGRRWLPASGTPRLRREEERAARESLPDDAAKTRRRDRPVLIEHGHAPWPRRVSRSASSRLCPKIRDQDVQDRIRPTAP